MGKGDKTGVGRALVKHHNQMAKDIKEKGKYYRSQHKKVLESVTEVNDIDAIIEKADEAHQLFSDTNPLANPINLDSASSTSQMTPEERREQQKKEEALHASSLRVPRRPPWDAKMSVEELDANERLAFLSWRRSLASVVILFSLSLSLSLSASFQVRWFEKLIHLSILDTLSSCHDVCRLEENEKLVLTPFEKNLDIWRQLWRVVERSDLLVMVVDARNPLFYRCPDLEVYAKEIDEHRRTLLLVNKADLLPSSIRDKWANYFRKHGILFLFWSAKAASAALEGKPPNYSNGMQSNSHESVDADTKIYGRDDLLARLQSEAEEIVSKRDGSRSNVVVGFVGYPNVGKSSTINALVGEKRTGVTSTPGKTKHFQTLIISEKLTLCDCPGLVFPSFTSSRYEMIASGVLPIDRMTEHREAIQVVADRVPRSVIENVYNITLPKPKPYEPQSRPPWAAEVLRSYCASRGYVAASGLPDETRAARQILKDYIDGKLPHFEMPPDTSDDDHTIKDVAGPNSSEVLDSDSSDDEVSPTDEHESAPSLDHVLDDLNSFDMDNGLASRKAPVQKKSLGAPHKQHKKPQRKKDRSWRVGGVEGDGMPVVRVFQKPANTGPSKV